MPYLFLLLVLADVCALIDVLPSFPLIGGFKAAVLCGIFFLTDGLSDKWKCGFLSLKSLLRFLLWTVVVVFVLLSLLNVCGCSFYGFGVTRRMFTIFQQTSLSETSQFLPSFGSHMAAPRVLAVVSGGVVLVFFGGRLLRFLHTKCRLLSLVGLAVWALAGGFSLIYHIAKADSGRNNYIMLWRAAKAYTDMKSGQRRAAELFAQNKPLPHSQTIVTKDVADNVIVVLGESVDTRHCSSYGYTLATNRFSSAWENEPGFLLFSDAISPYCSTEETVSRLFTFMDDRPESDCEQWADFPNVVAVMKAAGYKCFWLSNQQRLGKYMDCATPIAELSDSAVWLREYESDVVLNQFDDALLPHLRNALADTAPKKFIVMHLYGAHPSYDKRYPSSRMLFSPDDVPVSSLAKTDAEKEIVAHYDNAVAFSDSVMACVLAVVKDNSARTSLVFLSDHGQNVFDSDASFGHHPAHVNVPMYVFCNAAYCAANQGLFGSLSNHKDSPVSSAHLIHTFLGLGGVSYSAYCPSLDLTSVCYQLQVRYANQKLYVAEK